MRIGIVGSRKRQCKQVVYDLIDSFPEDTVIISGGCKGVDTWAEERAVNRGLTVRVFKPNILKMAPYHEIVKAYYDRNFQIVINSDIIYAFVSKDRIGGTENTIKQAQKSNVKVILMEE